MSDDYLPEDDSYLGDGLKVNFTDKEAQSKALDPIPRGKYHLKITDGEVAFCGPESKNPGKPYWKLELTVQSGPHENRRVWTNVMLFDGALYSLSQLMKALGYDITAGEFHLPDIEELIEKDVIGKVRIKAETEKYDARNEIGGFEPYNDKTPTSRETSLLP